MESKKNNLWNIPNGLCFLRIALIPFFIVCYLIGFHKIATVLLIFSGFTDYLDGFIARKFDMVTDFGKVIDPIADKLTQVSVAIVLLYVYPLVSVLLAIIIIKDIMLAFVGMYLYQFGVKIDGALWCGKIATCYFYLVVILLVAVDIAKTPLSFWLIISSCVLMLIALIEYGRELYRLDRLVKERNQ